MAKEFKFRQNTATIIFLVAYTVYMGILVYKRQFSELTWVGIFGVIAFVFFIGFRPYKYTVDKKIVTIYYRLWKNTEVNLMECETICDPVSRWADIATRPHAIEIYTDTKKRYCFFPTERVEFVSAVLQGNKRIHCTVKEYTDIHRKLEKKMRKERRKAEKQAARDKIENGSDN